MLNLLRVTAESKFLIVIFCAAFVLQGCATMNQDECLVADWVFLGERDGIRGHTESMFESRANACAKHGITADRLAYMDGYSSGLREFCVPSNGYKNGIDKIEYHYICPIDLQGQYLREYVKGLNIAISQIDYELRELDIYYRSAVVDLKSANNEDEEKSADRRLRQVNSDINSLQYEYDELRDWLNIAIDQM